MLRHRLAAATALLLALTACGGGSDDSADDPIAGVDETPSRDEGTASPDEDPTPEPGDQEIPLPDDVELVFDWDTPDDPAEAAALDGAADYLRAIAASVVAQDPEGGIYRGHAMGGAQGYAREQIQAWVDNGWTMHGTDRYYDAEVAPVESTETMRAQFCGDSTEMIGKDVETGEPLSEEQQLEESVYHYDLVLAEAPGVEGFWQVHGIEVTEAGASCGG